MKAEVITGDAKEVMRDIPDGSIDLTVTSPPYDNLRAYNGFTFDFESIAQELFRVTKQGGVVVWVVGDATIDGSETGTSFRQALYFKEVGFNLHDTMIYWKNAFPFPESVRYAQTFEYMFVFSKGRPSTTNICRVPTKEENRIKKQHSFRASNGEMVPLRYETGKAERNQENIWAFNVGFMLSSKDDLAFTHPAIFPERLAYDHIISWSNKGDTILDPMCGSGTTGRMAVIAKRNFIGIDISEEYCEIARARISRAQGIACDIPRRPQADRDLPLLDMIA